MSGWSAVRGYRLQVVSGMQFELVSASNGICGCKWKMVWSCGSEGISAEVGRKKINLLRGDGNDYDHSWWDSQRTLYFGFPSAWSTVNCTVLKSSVSMLIFVIIDNASPQGEAENIAELG
ncbi:hypothetical protein NECAME_06924 [Necator americanus]|uniref:Uncharacterized protein n=1 Tax=Necator americanus TaxID=51031 RepID=W2TT67_NECAM|nr:hypothetical protein NECAME_06924 [Necator americanus]ETN84291.1 hypothetical protein NECAME_06924 [Necator americanus]